MQQLITEVLDFRRLEQGKMPFHVSCQNLVPFVRQQFDAFKDYAVMNRIQYKLETVEEDIPVWFDPVQIRKVFNNLLSNAFKFTPNEGCITVSLLRKRKLWRYVSPTQVPVFPGTNKTIYSSVFTRRIMQPVFLFSGSGIGLSLTHEIIQQHKGFDRSRK